MSNQKEQLEKLIVPFKASEMGKLPKPYKKDSKKGNCDICGGFHGLPALHLDFVGHAALTKRFLEVDPMWTWEPLAIEPNGAPAIDGNGGMWIKLTICGVTRIGYGDGGGKRGGNAVKEAIGDALRNAGMRFGAALELWHKGDLYEFDKDQGKIGPKEDNIQDTDKFHDEDKKLEEIRVAFSKCVTVDELNAVAKKNKAIADKLSPAMKNELNQYYTEYKKMLELK